MKKLITVIFLVGLLQASGLIVHDPAHMGKTIQNEIATAKRHLETIARYKAQYERLGEELAQMHA